MSSDQTAKESISAHAELLEEGRIDADPLYVIIVVSDYSGKLTRRKSQIATN